MTHLFEFVVGFALAMMVELCWHGVVSVMLGTPPHIVRFFPGSRGGVLVHLMAFVWLMLAVAGVILFAVRLVDGEWWQAATIGAGAVAWVVYWMTYYRVLEIMRAEAKTRLEG